MDKKILSIIFVFLLNIPFITSIPQFLIFQGDVKIDGRIAPTGTIVDFSINGINLNSTLVDSHGKYGPIIIQGFSQYYGRRINITINGYEAEQRIFYIYPQDINLNLSTLTEKALRISNFFPQNSEIEYEIGNQTFNVSTQTGYSDPIKHTWFLDGNKVLEITNTDFSSYVYERVANNTSEHDVSIIASDGYLSVSKDWILLAKEEKISIRKSKVSGYKQIGEICEPNWQCSSWSSCNNKFMTRKCQDTNNCEYEYNRPIERTSCKISKSLVEKTQENWKLPTILFSFVITLVLLIILVALLKR